MKCVVDRMRRVCCARCGAAAGLAVLILAIEAKPGQPHVSRADALCRAKVVCLLSMATHPRCFRGSSWSFEAGPLCPGVTLVPVFQGLGICRPGRLSPKLAPSFGGNGSCRVLWALHIWAPIAPLHSLTPMMPALFQRSLAGGG